MISKKYLLFVPFVCLTMTLGACQQSGGEVTPPVDPTVSSITIKQGAEPQKEFTVGDEFTVAGGVLVVSYSDQTTKDVNMALSMITNPPVMTTAVESYTVNVLYEGARTSYNIKIKDAPVTVSSIAIKQGAEPQKEFVVGDEFTVAGGVLVVTKSDDTREEVGMTLAMIVNAPDMSEVHENYTVNVLYEGASTSYTINVTAGDTREEVTIGISYDYNGGESTEASDGLKFTVNKSYHFYYGTNPSEARDSTSYKYLMVVEDSDPVDLGSEKPYDKGDYIYQVAISEGDESYKPTKKEISFSIIDPVIKEVLLNKDNVDLSTGSQEIEGVTFNYKGATAAEGAVATLTRTAPGINDNYIDIASPINFTDSFEGLDKYIQVFGSFDGENYALIDTLTRSKQTTDRLDRYFFVRLVAAPIEGDTVTIKSISFAYEENGVPGNLAARSEYSDYLNLMSPVEEGAYYNESEVLFNDKLSTKSVKMRNLELAARVNFGFTVSADQAKYIKISFKAKLSDGATFVNSEGETKTSVSFYARPVSDETRIGDHKAVKELTLETASDWVDVEFYLGDFFEKGAYDCDKLDFWINRKVTGFVYVDDFRIAQRDAYPVANKLIGIKASDVSKTEYEVGEEFVFDGKVTAEYTDYTKKVIENTDSALVIEKPNTSLSGEKTVIIKYTDGGIEATTSYKITVTGADPKAEETMTIVSDANDYANVASRRNPELSTYMGCAVASDETEMTYNDSKEALRIGGPTKEDYCYFTVYLKETIVANQVTVRFFAKDISSVGNLILQLRDDAEKVKAVYSDSNSKADVTTDQTKTNKFTATDAGNGWTLYEHTYYTAGVTSGVRVLRIMFHTEKEVALTELQSCVLDGIEVFAANS